MDRATSQTHVDVSRPYVRPTIPAHVDLRLDANEGPPPARAILDAVRGAGGDVLRRYPDGADTERAFAAYFGVEPDSLLMTAGADDAIDRLCRVALSGGGTLVLPSPSFEMFERYATLAGGRVVRVPWPEGAWPVDAVLDTIDGGTRMVAMVSPNNPTGAVASFDALERVATAHPDVLVVLDHAYAEFADEDLTRRALELPNVVVLRTMSKAWSLAGLRVGFALGAAERIAPLRAAGPPYAVSQIAVEVARAALENARGAMESTVASVRDEREALTRRAAELGLRPLPSQANFVLAGADDPARVDRGLQCMGIKIRTWPGHPELDGYVRLGCPADRRAFARFDRALGSLLRPGALLLDMDGVIADEGESYREAIRATLAEFDVEMDRERIAQMKAAGNANNDWRVTQRLLTEAGIAVDYDEVVARFERHYQGTDGQPGLHEKETLLVERNVLEALRARMPLAIVTGRPRRDAIRFLERFELLDLFDAVVTVDDVARGKPDPEPVELALSQLGVRTAWMVGDTPDDLVAARAASVLPIGIGAPSRRDAVSLASLDDAGAFTVLDRLADLQEMLP